MPQTEVAFSPTAAFQKAFPDEVKQQTEAFSRPTWAPKVEQAPGVAAKAEKPAVAQEAAVEIDVLVKNVVIGAAVVFLAGYAIKRYVLPLVWSYGQVE